MTRRNAIVQTVELYTLEASGVEPVLPAAIESLLHEFATVFEEPKGLPPQRQFDHAIPLLPGAQPVNLRPYRYNPA